MTVTCPAGHSSATEDYCDACGLRIGTPSEATAPPPGPAPTASVEPVEAHEPAESVQLACPRCGEENAAGTRFCEGCGLDLLEGGPHRPASPTSTAPTIRWVAVVRVDPEAFEEHQAGDVSLPDDRSERRFELTTERVRIGRGRSTADDHPEIDLSAPPVDIGVSHDHAVLVLRGNRWALIDLGSTNGTYVNGATEPIDEGLDVELQAGDQIHLGAWTTICLEPATADPPAGAEG